MIRMTLMLLLGIGATMVIFGNDNGVAQGSDDSGVEVARNSGTEPGLLNRVGTLIEGTATAVEPVERVPLADERRAIEVALAATVAPEAPATPRAQTVQITGTGPAIPVASQPAVIDDGMWYVTGTTVNLRGGPSTNDAVVGRVRLGQRAEVIEETADGWFRIRTVDDGQNGFIFGRFLSQNRPG